jgi:C4-dicarboxylate-specific signal transduction histidine kinase
LTVIALSIEDSLAELEKTSCPQTVTEGLRDSLSEVSNVTAIIERFRNFARKSSQKTIDRVELGVVAERIAKLLNRGAQQAGIKLHLGRLDKLPAVYLNEKELEQLFFALVQNAVQAADGKEGRELAIDGAVKHGLIELRFSDNCGGIQPENLDKLFEPFFTTKPAGEGTGLGLCIVQRIAERCGGGVRVENRPGEGATFIITLGIDRNRM